MFKAKIPTHQFLAEVRTAAASELQAHIAKVTAKSATKVDVLAEDELAFVRELISEHKAKKAKDAEANATATTAKAK